MGGKKLHSTKESNKFEREKKNEKGKEKNAKQKRNGKTQVRLETIFKLLINS